MLLSCNMPSGDHSSYTNLDRRAANTQPIESSQPSPSRRRQPSRASKDSPSKSKPQQSSPTLRESPDHDDDMNIAAMHPRHVSSRQRRSSSAAASDESRDLKLTRTGRISKALKGQRVHKCEFCDKVFTRAEHCRRHQLNHGDPSVCDFPGCGKKFYREDLFARHKEEHKGGFSADISTSGYPVSGAASSRVLGAFPRERPSPRSPASQPMVTGSSLYSTHESSYYPHVTQNTFDAIHSYSGSSINSSPYTHASPQPNQHSFSHGLDVYFPDYYIPTAPYYSAEVPTVNASGSRSPASVSSSIPYAWRPEEDSHRRNMASPTNSDVSLCPPMDPTLSGFVSADMFGGAKPMFEDDLSFDDQDAFDENTLVRELATIPGLMIGPDGLAYLGPRQAQFLDSYWEHFHPVFPILHRPTFNAVGCSPLLRVLILTIGAQYVEDSVAKRISRSLREVCCKLFEKRRYTPPGASRLWDLQTIFLAEAFSLFKSRRPKTDFSHRFEELVSYLRNDTEVFFSKSLDRLTGVYEENTIGSVQSHWFHIESKRRLFLASYILEVHQSILFASNRPVPDLDLPCPCSPALWEASTHAEWHKIAVQDARTMPAYVFEVFTTLPILFQNNVFLSSIIIAYGTRTRDAYSQTQACDISSVIDQSPPVLLAYHAAAFALHAPIRDILAVTGETFVLGEKLATCDMFTQANIDLRTWVSDTEPLSNTCIAIFHAFKLLRIAFDHRKTATLPVPQQHWPRAQQPSTLKPLQEQWALYVASITIWCVAVWPSRTPPSITTPTSASSGTASTIGSNTSISTSTLPSSLSSNSSNKEPKPTPAASLEAGVSRFLTDSEHNCDLQKLSAAGTRATLEWVRGRCRGQLGGLIGDAWEVLGRLVCSSIIVASN